MNLIRILSFALVFSVMQAWGADTAYQALRFLGEQKGQDVLQKVLEVQGEGGMPQPLMWRVLVDDPQARGGVREFELQSTKILAERTPVRRFVGATEGAIMDFGKLNLDSSGAFTVAEKEAQVAKLGFDSVDYLLSASEDKQPVWTIRLMDAKGVRVGEIQVSASDGRIVRRSFDGAPVVQRDVYVGVETTEPSRESNVEHKSKNFGDRVKRHFIRDGARLQKFFTGKRTIDRDYRDEADE